MHYVGLKLRHKINVQAFILRICVQPHKIDSYSPLKVLYYHTKNYYNLIGLEQWYFSLIWNTYMWKLQTFCG